MGVKTSTLPHYMRASMDIYVLAANAGFARVGV